MELNLHGKGHGHRGLLELVNPPLRMRRAGYSSRCVCVCHAAALADGTFSTIEAGINTK